MDDRDNLFTLLHKVGRKFTATIHTSSLTVFSVIVKSMSHSAVLLRESGLVK